MANFDPTESTPLDRSPKKFGTGDYIGGLYGCVKFGKNSSMGASGQGVNYNDFLYLFLFHELSTGQTRRPIFTLNGSNDADSRKHIPFGGFR